MRSNFSLRTASAVIGAFGLAALGLAQSVPTPDWTADSTTLSGHAAGPVLDTRVSPNGTYVASVVTKAGTAGGLEVRVRNASTGAFLWSADMGPAPTAGLPRLAFSNDSSRLYFSSDADPTATFDGQLEAKNPATGANVAGFPINDADTDFIATRTVTSPNGTWYAYQDGRNPGGVFQSQIIVRNTAGNAVYARVNIGGSGVFPDVRDFQFTNEGTQGELIVALVNGDFYRVNLFSGAKLDYHPTHSGAAVNRIERIPGDVNNFMVARESGTTLHSMPYAGGAIVRDYTNATTGVPVGAKRGIAYFGTTTGTGVAYGLCAVGQFDFTTFVRVDNGDRIAQYDLRRSGQPASDSRMNAVAGVGGGATNLYFGAIGAASNERVLSVRRPEYGVSLSPTAVIGGQSSTGTVFLPGPAPTGGFTANMTYGTALSGPATVTVPAGATSQTFTVNTVTVDADAAPLVTATFPHTFDADPLSLERAKVAGVAFSPTSGQTGDATTATVTLNAPVTANRVVSLSYSNPAMFTTNPATVTVLAGSSSATVNLIGANASSDLTGTLTGTLNGVSANGSYTVIGVAVSTVVVAPDPVNEGAAATATITLDKATTQDRTIGLSYAAAGFTAPPATATVTAGNTSVNVPLTAVTTNSDIAETVTASLFGSSANGNVTVQTTKITGISVNPNPAPNSSNTTGTVTVSGNVPVARTVNLTYTPAGNFDVAPATVTIPMGANTANFTFKSKVIPAGFAAQIDGALGGATQSVIFNVAPVSLLGAQVYPMNAFAGQKVACVVRLAAPRASALTVTVTSSHPTIIAGGTVNIPAGQTYGVYTATAGTPSATQWVTMTASGGGETRQEASQVRPASNVLASGLNSNFEVGNGITRNREFMSVVQKGEGVLQAVYSKDTLVVLKSNGTVWTVGKGEFGQHGDGTSGPAATKTVLTQVPGLSNIREIASNSEMAILALTSTGQVYGWGQNPAGQAGKSPFGLVTTPTLIASLSNVIRVGTAGVASFALDANGDIWSWGSNGTGAGARGAGGNTAVPVKLTTVAGPFVELGLGRNFGFAVHANGNLYGWGVNTDGQLGLGDFVNRTTMTLVPVSNVRQIGGGVAYSILLRTPPHGVIPTGGNRVVMTTGDNTTGQRGQGAVGGADTNVFAPIINGHGNTNQIGAGNRHAFYVSQGSPRSWGVGSLGERADGTFVANSGTPTVMPSTPTVSGILASVNNSVLITQTPTTGRPEAIITNGTNLSTVNLRTNTVTALTGTVPAGHTVVGGGEIAGLTTRNEIITRDGGGTLYYMEANGSVLGASTATSVALITTEVLVGVANMDNAGRMDFVTADTVTGQVVARLFNGTTQTGTRNLYTLAANEVVAGVGDFDVDRAQDLLIYNTVTRIFTVRRYNTGGTFLGTASLVTSPNTPVVPAAIPAVPAGLVPVAAAETMTGLGYNVVFVNTGTNAFETWQFCRLNRVATGLVGPVIPGGYGFAGFWR